MKTNFLKILTIATLIFGMISCSSDDSGSSDNNPIDPNVEVITATKNGNGFNYKVFWQEENSQQTRRGIIILAVGDGGTANDGTLNAQCDALARKGYVAITTTYRPIPATYQEWYINFNQDMEQIISNETMAFDILRNKVVLGGLSRGGNLLMGSVLPGQMGAVPPIAGIKGVILECAGGDAWKGSAILFPVLFMSNATDNTVGTDANGFKNGLQNNSNPNVKNKSKCLIIPGQGHCTNSGEYKGFITDNIDSWF